MAQDNRPIAPWSDFAGQQIRHGDRLIHPEDGSSFVAVLLRGHSEESDAWRAVYEDGSVSRLVLQLGEKGQASLEPAELIKPKKTLDAIRKPDIF